jgi:hypothetical protein
MGGGGFDPRTINPVASHYTDWAIPAHFIQCIIEEIKKWSEKEQEANLT